MRPPVRSSLFLALALALAACAPSAVVRGGPFKGDPASATYDLEGTEITLANGTFEEKTGDKPDDVIATDLTGTRLDADFDGDETTDCAVVVTRDQGPLKVHYLAVIPGGSSDAFALPVGTNVLVESLELGPQGSIVVTYLGHEEGVPVDAPPTTTMKKSYKVDGKRLVPVGAKPKG